MTDQNNNNNGNGTPVVDKGVALPPEVAEKDREIARLTAKLAQIESEGKSTKAERDALQKNIDAAEAERLKEQNKYKELYEREVERTKSSESRMNRKIARAEVRNAAIAAGILDSDMADLISLDSVVKDGEIDYDRIEELVSDHKAKKPSWYKTDGKQVVDEDPTAGNDQQVDQRGKKTGSSARAPAPAAKAGEVDVSKMTRDEYRAYKSKHLKELQKTYR